MSSGRHKDSRSRVAASMPMAPSKEHDTPDHEMRADMIGMLDNPRPSGASSPDYTQRRFTSAPKG